jgi:transcriptional regulator of aroF, aroG, tyrA and aromatic amino acid transport
VLHGMPHLEKHMVVITISHPTISDIVTRHNTQLKDPSDWDYLLYLETTKAGRLINMLVPSNTPAFLEFKIELLKAALSTKAVLIDAPQEDLEGIVKLLHHLSMREAIHTIMLERAITDSSMLIRLFGINPLLAESKPEQQPILAQCGNESTLFISNIHYLDMESQNYLADFIRYGVFRIYKSDRKVPSAARIICSTDRDLYALVQEGKFSRNLYDELHTSKISMPSLITIPDEELNTLMDGYSTQVLADDTLQDLLTLTERDKMKMSHMRPDSLESLKHRVQQMMMSKSKRKNMPDEPQFNPAYSVTDPDLMQAKMLGKKALRDRKIMLMLWRKFKCQADIAKFLNVDRSSVWRRCREFNLE